MKKVCEVCKTKCDKMYCQHCGRWLCGLTGVTKDRKCGTCGIGEKEGVYIVLDKAGEKVGYILIADDVVKRTTAGDIYDEALGVRLSSQNPDNFLGKYCIYRENGQYKRLGGIYEDYIPQITWEDWFRNKQRRDKERNKYNARIRRWAKKYIDSRC